LEKKVKVEPSHLREANTLPDIAPACVLAASSINKSSINALSPVRDISTELAVTTAGPAQYQKPSAGSHRFGLSSDSILKQANRLEPICGKMESKKEELNERVVTLREHRETLVPNEVGEPTVASIPQLCLQVEVTSKRPFPHKP
jgi:hypothetical protein